MTNCLILVDKFRFRKLYKYVRTRFSKVHVCLCCILLSYWYYFFIKSFVDYVFSCQFNPFHLKYLKWYNPCLDLVHIIQICRVERFEKFLIFFQMKTGRYFTCTCMSVVYTTIFYNHDRFIFLNNEFLQVLHLKLKLFIRYINVYNLNILFVFQKESQNYCDLKRIMW